MTASSRWSAIGVSPVLADQGRLAVNAERDMGAAKCETGLGGVP
ncbi:hypothetical protein [Nocardia brasiliensis]